MSLLPDDQEMALAVLLEVSADQKWTWCSNPECICAGSVHETLHEISEHLEKASAALAALKNAIDDEGPHPKYHKVKVDQLRLNWPTLWKAIEELIR